MDNASSLVMTYTLGKDDDLVYVFRGSFFFFEACSSCSNGALFLRPGNCCVTCGLGHVKGVIILESMEIFKQTFFMHSCWFSSEEDD